jgi:hypothetical protein
MPAVLKALQGRNTRAHQQLVCVSPNAGYCISIYFKLPEMSDKRLMSARTKVRLNSPTSWRPRTSWQVLGLRATSTVSLMMKAVHLQDNGRQQQQQQQQSSN